MRSDAYRIYQAFTSCFLQTAMFQITALCLQLRQRTSCNTDSCQIHGHCQLAHLVQWTLIPCKTPPVFLGGSVVKMSTTTLWLKFNTKLTQKSRKGQKINVISVHYKPKIYLKICISKIISLNRIHFYYLSDVNSHEKLRCRSKQVILIFQKCL